MAAISVTLAGGENLVKFLDMLAWSEGTSTSKLTQNDGYDVIVSGVSGPEIFTDYSDHPFINRPPQIVRLVPRLTSTAAGRYQLLERYYNVYKHQLKLPDFSPLSQDKIALQQIKERLAIEPILSGDIQAGIELCSNIWASLPGNDYAQGGKSLQDLMMQFEAV